MSGGLLLLGLAPAGGPLREAGQAHDRLAAHAGFDALVLALDTLPADRAAEEWAVAAAMAQNAVLSAYAAEEDVLPVALGAAFSGAPALAAHLAEEGAALIERMQALAGKVEYIVQILTDRQSAPPPADAPPATGAAFLQRRRAARDRRHHMGRDRQTCAEAAHRDLTALALASAVRPPKAGGPVLDLSLLIPRSGAEALIAEARRLADGAAAFGLGVRVIGPCAPHSFLSLAETCDA